jgi:predicted small metal-binding protein
MHLGTNQDPSVMLSVNCRATGSYDCDYVAKGNTEEELIRDIDQHARQVHDLGPGGCHHKSRKSSNHKFTLYRSGGYRDILFMTLFNCRDISQTKTCVPTS